MCYNSTIVCCCSLLDSSLCYRMNALLPRIIVNYRWGYSQNSQRRQSFVENCLDTIFDYHNTIPVMLLQNGQQYPQHQTQEVLYVERKYSLNHLTPLPKVLAYITSNFFYVSEMVYPPSEAFCIHFIFCLGFVFFDRADLVCV